MRRAFKVEKVEPKRPLYDRHDLQAPSWRVTVCGRANRSGPVTLVLSDIESRALVALLIAAVSRPGRDDEIRRHLELWAW